MTLTFKMYIRQKLSTLEVHYCCSHARIECYFADIITQFNIYCEYSNVFIDNCFHNYCQSANILNYFVCFHNIPLQHVFH